MQVNSPGPDRAAAREQRPPHPDRDAGGDADARTPAAAPCSCRPGTRRSACRARGTSSGRCGMQQVLAYETDLLEYEDIFDGTPRGRGQGRRA
ncbi:hypothetical protein ACRAWD_09400 [Caulobacter segnis]